jgi:hypothetical protein
MNNHHDTLKVARQAAMKEVCEMGSNQPGMPADFHFAYRYQYRDKTVTVSLPFMRHVRRHIPTDIFMKASIRSPSSPCSSDKTQNQLDVFVENDGWM